MINREAKSLIEALRLQKLRAVEYILDHINLHKDKDVAVAIEISEDVYALKTDSELYEQNKNYDPDSSFTINSEEVLNSLCSFLDIWIDNQFSNSVDFCFLSTNQVAKEKKTQRIKKLNITLPNAKILDLLSSNNRRDISSVAGVVKDILFDYYREQYSEKSESQKTINALASISQESWIDFLCQIKWIFGYTSVQELEKSVEQKITRCRFYSNYDNKNQEKFIKSNLLDLVEAKSIKNHKIFRLVTVSDVELKFQQALYEKKQALQIDEVHRLWEQIEKPKDFRNLKDKILSVCPSFSEKRLSQLQRTVSMAKVTETSIKNSTQYLALKYRIYDFCDRELDQKLRIKNENKFSENEINNLISEINKACVVEFEDLKKQYDYGIERTGIILELFIEFIDSCYLALD